MITCTPSLFIGEPFEEARLSDLYWWGDNAVGAADSIRFGHSSLVADEKTARQVLSFLGVDEDWVEHQIAYGTSGS